MRLLAAALGLVLLASSGAAAGEKLVYAVRHEEGAPGYPGVLWTRLFAVDPITLDRWQIFSDETLPIRLLPRHGHLHYPGQVLAASGRSIFAHAVERRVGGGPWHAENSTIYRLTSDGSNGFAKVTDVQGEQGLNELFVDLTGSKIAYTNRVRLGIVVFVHDAATGQLLQRLDIGRACGACYVATIGWLRHGAGVYVTLTTGDVHVTPQEAYAQAGSYLFDADGSRVTRLLTKLPSPARRRGFNLATDEPPWLYGDLPDGRYLVRYLAWRRPVQHALSASSILRVVDPDGTVARDLPLGRMDGVEHFKISPSGAYLAFYEKVYDQNHQVWIKDLGSGQERQAVSLAEKPFTGDFLGLVGWIEE